MDSDSTRGEHRRSIEISLNLPKESAAAIWGYL